MRGYHAGPMIVEVDSTPLVVKVNALRDSFVEARHGFAEMIAALERLGSLLPPRVGRYRARTRRRKSTARNRRAMARASRRRNRGTR